MFICFYFIFKKMISRLKAFLCGICMFSPLRKWMDGWMFILFRQKCDSIEIQALPLFPQYLLTDTRGQ